MAGFIVSGMPSGSLCFEQRTTIGAPSRRDKTQQHRGGSTTQNTCPYPDSAARIVTFVPDPCCS